MPVRKYKPTSPGRRQMGVSGFDEITRSEPEKSLLVPLKRNMHDRRKPQPRAFAVDQCHIAADDARLLKRPDPPPAGRSR